MAQIFFPRPITADIREITGSVYPEELETISCTFTQSEVEETIRNLPSDKASGPDGIPNRFLKYFRAILSKVLKDLFNTCLAQGYHPKKLEELKTVVLRKTKKS